MYNIKDKKQINLKKGEIAITLDLGVGAYNPDESSSRGLITDRAICWKPWLKFENTWYPIIIAWKYNSLEDIAAYFERDCCTEEMFLEKNFEHIFD